MSLFSVCYFLGYTCLILAWLVPDHIPPWNTFPQEALAILAVVLLWPWRKIRVLPVRLCVMAVFCTSVALFQYAAHMIDRGDLLWALLLTGLLGMAASLGAHAALTEPAYAKANTSFSPIEGWCLALLAAALASVVIGLAQWQGVTQGLFMYGSTGRVYGNLAQPNQFATLLVLGLGALVYLDQQARLRGVWPHLAALLLVFALAASESRTGALSITLLVLAIAGWGGPIRQSLRWLAPALAFFWLFYTTWKPLSSWMGGSVTRAGAALDSSTRFELWQQMAAAIALKPWLGYGWLNVGEAQQAVAPYLGGTINMSHAHNVFLDLLVWFGIPLGGLIVLACIAWGLQILHTLLKKKTPQAHTAFLCLLTLLPIAVHSMLEFPFAYMYFAVVIAFFLGALEATLGYTRPLGFKGRWVAKAFALATVACAAWMGKEYMRIEEDFRALRMEREFLTQPENRHTYAPAPVLLSQFGNLISALRVDLQAPVDAATLETVRSAATRFPWLLTAQHYYLVLLANEHCEDAARQRLVLKSLFGKFGIVKTDEAIEQNNLGAHCSK